MSVKLYHFFHFELENLYLGYIIDKISDSCGCNHVEIRLLKTFSALYSIQTGDAEQKISSEV